MERASQLGGNTGQLAIVADQRPERPGMQRLVEGAGRIVPDRPKQRARAILDPTIFEQIIVDQADGVGACWNEADLVAFTVDAEMGHALAGLAVAGLEPTKFITAKPVIKDGGEDGAITFAL